jgi:adenosylhomocysteine nucleosidase
VCVAPIGVCTGLKREAALFAAARRDGVAVRVAVGMGATAAARAASALADQGCRGLVSFGFAGALAPQVDVGTLIVPEAVVGRDGQGWPTDAAWRQRLLAVAGGAAVTGRLLGDDRVAATRHERTALATATGAIAIDTESHAIGRVAARRGLPFLVVRAISDRVDDPLPPWLTACVSPAGEVLGAALARALLRDPRRLAPLWPLALGSRRALRCLLPFARRGSPLYDLPL